MKSSNEPITKTLLFGKLHSMSDQGFSSSIVDQSSIPEERRIKPRLQCSYPSTLKGHSISGLRYQTPAVLSNISASGMYLRTKRQMMDGETLSIIVRLSTAPLYQKEQFRLSATCQVVRVEPKADGTFGIAVRIHNHRYL